MACFTLATSSGRLARLLPTEAASPSKKLSIPLHDMAFGSLQ
jgi:hypothetical protein